MSCHERFMLNVLLWCIIESEIYEICFCFLKIKNNVEFTYINHIMLEIVWGQGTAEETHSQKPLETPKGFPNQNQNRTFWRLCRGSWGNKWCSIWNLPQRWVSWWSRTYDRAWLCQTPKNSDLGIWCGNTQRTFFGVYVFAVKSYSTTVYICTN